MTTLYLAEGKSQPILSVNLSLTLSVEKAKDDFDEKSKNTKSRTADTYIDTEGTACITHKLADTSKIILREVYLH